MITDIRQQAETIRQTELEKTLRRLPDLTDAERIRIEAMTQALVKKILDIPPIVCAPKRPSQVL